ncbi:Succinate-semialdehyde dehydrogenase [NADP(+)] GabD [Paracoccus haematequi]|uniref:Succinate-semialdehyde dehydrogenase [NADP(+)] GabD n=1 Tax=Paracoccus haematequi TaxID=2491866 RepID=A0A3S4DXR4_9RHOB|nr:NAD-dependent succinate-semialdehyde dehydrogenase [Paracoccus haematequi]VDS09755.1 Succinate-semialdehyde dehydrogenase [NADP(+)] GabD [Paracoccus haematequi]
MTYMPPTAQAADLMRPLAFINGEWVGADDGATLDVTDPATGEVIGQVPDMGLAETRRAIAAAEAALPSWRALAAGQRAAILKRWHALIMAHQEELALILTREQGKPLAEARGEIAYGASFVEWFAEEARRTYGDTIPAPKAGQRIIVQKQPVGVCGLIIPWNFPSALFHRKAAAALAAGCTAVLKPSEFTPFSALALAELGRMAGLPPGVLNVVTGMPVPIGAALMEAQSVRKISFTGSTRVGKLLLEQAARTVKKVSLELGGNAPLIVFDDADLKTAVAACMNSKFRNAGQTCVCANRIFVQDGIHDAFSAALKEAVEALKVGPGTEPGVTTGPLINDAAVAKVERHIADALAKGAVLVTGGGRHALGGRYFTPTILSGADAGMELARDETFGPVAPLFRFSTEDEAIRAANATEYGLAAYIFTRDIDRMFRVTEALETGMVGVNEGLISNEVAPFGGIKESGLGREGSYHGIEEYLEMKYLMISPVLNA